MTGPRRLAAVRCLTIEGKPDGTHLSIEEWSPRWDEWLTGMALCGQSAEQGALPAGTTITCQPCENHRDNYDRALDGRPTAEQEELDTLRRKLDRIDQMATAWEQQLPDTIRTATAVEALRTIIREQP